MSPLLLAELQKLHPAQQAVFQELMIWGNQGGSSLMPSDVAIERALAWAKQTPIPPDEPEPELEV